MTRSRIAPLALALAVAAPLCAQTPANTPSWLKGGTCYEIFVRSFFDSDADGVGDLPGLTRKLDYISQLGANCIWLTPVAQSPSYHGYDVTNYYAVNRDFGTNEDFKAFVREAHRRGIKVLFDLVLNHTSNEHPYFKSAILSANSPYRDWYLWSPTQKKYSTWQAQIWHPAGQRNEFYFGLFWSGMPDWNLDNPAVTAEAKKIARFWLDSMGVDGFRFDAVQHFFEDGELVRNAPRVHPWLREYQMYLQSVKPDIYTVGEVWENIEMQATYYPDQLTSYFTFDIADGLLDAAKNGNGKKLLAAVEKAQRTFPPLRWTPFLSNHDQTRVMTALNGDVARAKLAATLLLTLPGYPFIYYGEEIGMTGLKYFGDQRIRTPMQWTRTAGVGFSPTVPWEPLQPDSFTANVEAQDADSTSLLNHYRRLIHQRSASEALGGGDLVVVPTKSDAVIAYLRRAPGDTLLVVANLSTQRITQSGIKQAQTLEPLSARIIQLSGKK